MRVLVLHSRYLSGDVSGENRVVADEVEALRSGGHEVSLFEPEPDVDGTALVRTATRAIWSTQTARTVANKIRASRIDVVHVHNLFPTLSPSVLRAAARSGAAVVMTLHNYRLLCLPASLMRDGRRCEDCVGRTPWPGVLHACYRDSRPGSAVLAASLTVHRAAGSFSNVHRFAAVSEVVRRTHIRGGFPAERVQVKWNFAPAAPERQGAGAWFLSLGRLAPEKGIETLLDAWERLSPRGVELRIAGEGPLSEELAARGVPGVTFLGTVRASDTAALIAGARAVLVPSTWEEPAVPRVVLEAYAAGVPVVVSDRGALPDGVDDGRTGFVVPAGRPDAWAARVGELMDDEVSTSMGSAALTLWSERFSPASGLSALESLYGQALDVSRAARS